MVAVRAFLRGVRRINVDHRHPGTLCLVRGKRSELSERPGTHHDPLGLTVPYPCADAGEVFQGDAAPGAFSLGHDVLGDAVIDVTAAALFFAPLPFQYSFRRPVCFAWSFLRSASWRRRYRLMLRPAMRSPSLVVAMLTMPRPAPSHPQARCSVQPR